MKKREERRIICWYNVVVCCINRAYELKSLSIRWERGMVVLTLPCPPDQPFNSVATVVYNENYRFYTLLHHGSNLLNRHR